MVTEETNSQPTSVVTKPESAPSPHGKIYLTPEQYSHVEKILLDLIGPIASTSFQQFKTRLFTLEQLVEELSVYLSASQITEFKRRIIPLVQPEKRSTQAQIDAPMISEESEISEVLICEYEQALAEIIGPIAIFLVRDTLASFSQISKVKLIETLSAEISDPQKAAEFRRRFIDST